MKILILEDEKLAAEKIKSHLENISGNHQIVDILRSVAKSVEWLRENPEPDLILSDIQLLDGLSFEIFQQVKIKCPVIFTTAFDQYAIQAFDVNSVAYLLKPIQEEKLKDALEKISGQSGSLISEADLDKLAGMLEKRMASTDQKKYKNRFLVKLGQKIKSISTKDISFFYTENKLTFLVVSNAEKFPVDSSLDELESILDPQRFFRLNRKYMITTASIREIHPYFKGRLKLELHHSDDDDIVASADKTPLLKLWLDN